MNRKLFLTTIKELNQDEELLKKVDEKKIVMIGIRTVDLVENFKRIMVKLDDAGLTDNVPENCIDFFEENLDDFMPKKEIEEPKGIEEESVKEESGQESAEEIGENPAETEDGKDDSSSELESELGQESAEEKQKKVKDEKEKKKNKSTGKVVKKGPSNKLLVYQEWEKFGGKQSSEELHVFIGEKLKLSTIKGWVNGWKKGKRLPAGVSK